MNNWIEIVRLAFRDYMHEYLLSFCAILGFASVLTPLLVLYGINYGIISTLSDRLIEDPRNRRITSVGIGAYTYDWFDRVRQDSRVEFVIPQTRSLAATMLLLKKDDVSEKGEALKKGIAVDLYPTDSGDPLLERWGEVPQSMTEITLPLETAHKLKVKKGDVIKGLIRRKMGGKFESVVLELTVKSVLSIHTKDVDSAYVTLPLLMATESYRDGVVVHEFGWHGEERKDYDPKFPSFIIFAKSIYDVSAVREMLAAENIEVYAKSDEIETVQNLERAFTLVYQVILFVAACGGIASMGSNQLATVRRKKYYLGVARLVGFTTKDIMLFPLIQAVMTALGGCFLAFGLYFFTSIIINEMFSVYLSEGESVCRLVVHQYGVALIASVCLAVVSSVYAAYKASCVTPTGALHHE